MKIKIVLGAIALLVLFTTFAMTVSAQTTLPPQPKCSPTGFLRDGINMTAVLINPTLVTGPVDATTCNIGVYYGPGSSGVIKGAEIYGANYFGVVANGDAGDITLDILNSNIHDIGESPHDGTQHGVGIYWRGFFAGGGVTGKIAGNTVTGYQKSGIVTNGTGVQATIQGNTVTGDGHVYFIAMNGIQIGYGASASVMKNRVSGNSYIGFPGDGSASGGIIVVGGAGYGQCPDGNDCPYTVNTKVTDNVLVNNDVGVYLTNLAADYSAPNTATNIKAVNNTISSDLCFNSSYQAGISDVGNNDKMINNAISGLGYGVGCKTISNPSGAAIDADTSFTNRPKVHANN
ncbi:MAG: hypothetical protein KGL67_02120 [Patescibacteria group bacterium]|nr:hypothetical protein [Patescibacteria group bacterium]